MILHYNSAVCKFYVLLLLCSAAFNLAISQHGPHDNYLQPTQEGGYLYSLELNFKFKHGNVYNSIFKVLKALDESGYKWDTTMINAKESYCASLFGDGLLQDMKEFQCPTDASLMDLLQIWNETTLPSPDELSNGYHQYQLEVPFITKESFFRSFSAAGTSLEKAQEKYYELEKLVNLWSGEINCTLPTTRADIENCPIIKAKFPSYKIIFPFSTESDLLDGYKALKNLYHEDQEIQSNVQLGLIEGIDFSDPYRVLESYEILPLFTNKEESKSVLVFDGPKKVKDSCSKSPQEASDGKFDQGEGAMWNYLNLSSIPECINKCTENNCPEVILIDTPVLPHPDIVEALEKASTTSSSKSCEEKSTSELSEEEKRIFHGTHLAGIIASADNEIGFVGMAPKAKIYSYDIAATNGNNIQQIIENLVSRNSSHPEKPLPIFVYSSRMGGYSRFSLENNEHEQMILTSQEEKIKHNMVKGILNRAEQFWVVALGEFKESDKETFPRSTVIGPLTPMVPQNLAEEQNVLLVGGCTDCSTPSVELYPNVFAAEKNYVHVVAPAENIVSLLDESSHGSLSGTSQATAFVGGLSAAMLSCHGKKYQVPSQLKEMILVTSKPFEKSPGQEYVATGVIDPLLALKDPKYVWLKKDSSYEPVLVSRWCARDINYSISNEEESSSVEEKVLTQNLKRISVQESNQHFLYVRPNEHREELGILESIGPIQINNFSNNNEEGILALIVECELEHFEECHKAAKDGENVKPIKLSELKDLVFGSQVPYFDIPEITDSLDADVNAQEECRAFLQSNGS